MRFGWIAVLCVVLVAGQGAAAEKTQLKTKKDKTSYMIGYDIGSNMKKQGIDVDSKVLSRGIIDALSGAKSLLTDQEVQEFTAELRAEIMAKQQARNKALAEKNKKEGEEFLAANAKKEGVKTTASGLQYKVITAGKGKKPKAEDTVTVNYRGTLIDGAEFDSSYKRGQPATFPVKGVIRGWTEALQLMPEGSKWTLYIPADLAYGERGAGPMIGPHSTLIFEVELLSIAKPGQ
jgi:FKBP-type peptidyl-prolyl cis-trans isomerase FklB